MSLLAILFDEYAALNPEPEYWLDFEDGGDGNGHCLRCIKKLDAGRNKYTGSGGSTEEDGCLHCGTCGKILDYTLTDHGALEELAHFMTVKFRRNKPLDRNTAYHLARLIEAKENDMDVIRIAARAIRSMRNVPKGAPLTSATGSGAS